MTYTVTLPPQFQEDEGHHRFIGTAETYEGAEALIKREVERSNGYWTASLFKIAGPVEAKPEIDRSKWLDTDQLVAFEKLMYANDLTLVDHHRHSDRYEPLALESLIKMALAADQHLGPPLPKDAPRPVLRCFYLTPEEDEALRVLSFRTGIKKNDLIVDGLQKLLAAAKR